MRGALTSDFEVRQIQIPGSMSVYLIVHYQQNKVTGHCGYVVYQTHNLENWDIYTAQPLIDMLLFDTTKEALDLGEQIVKSKAIVSA